MKYAIQIQENKSSWMPGIHRRTTKRNAQLFADRITKTGGKATVMRRRTNADKWQEI